MGGKEKGFFKSLKKELQNSSLEGNLMAKGKQMGLPMKTAEKWKGCQGFCLVQGRKTKREVQEGEGDLNFYPVAIRKGEREDGVEQKGRKYLGRQKPQV